MAEALDHFKPGLGDVALVLAFTGLRWEEAVAISIENVNLDGQWITVDRTASESGGRRDIRADLKTRAAERVVAIPDIAMPAVRRLADRDATGREYSGGKLYTRLLNGERGGYLGYAIVAPVPEARPRLHSGPQRRHRQVHRTRAAARLRVACDRFWRD